MFDDRLRRRFAPVLCRLAETAHGQGVTSSQLTVTGLALGVGAAGCAAAGWWWPALVCWLSSRLADGLDGSVARLDGPTVRGGFLDLMADFTVYGAFLVGIATAVPDARLATVVLMGAYYLSGSAFLAWSALSVAEQEAGPGRTLELDDNRSVRFVGGLAEGFETIVAYTIVCLVPQHAEVVLWVFAAMVGVTALQRIAFAASNLATVRAT